MRVPKSVAAIAVVAFTLAGCGSSPEPQATAPTPTKKSAQNAPAANAPGVVATVGDRKVSLEELDKYWAPVRYNLERRNPEGVSQEDMERNRQRYLERYIDELVQIEAAKELGVTVSQDDIAKNLQALEAKRGGASKFAELLESMGMSLEDFEAKTTRDRIIQQLKRQKMEDLLAEEDPSLLAFYKENPQRYRVRPTVSVREIVILKAPGMSDEDRQKLLARAEEAHQKAVDGGEFAELAREYSDAPTGQNGGLIAPLFEGRPGIDPRVWAAAQALGEPGDVTNVVETDNGFHILQLERKVDGGVRPFEQVKSQILTQLRNQRYREWVQEQRQQMDVSIAL